VAVPSAANQHPVSLSRWHTYPVARTVLAVTHNTTAATRLFDTLDLLAPDPRIQIYFSRTGSSVFATDTAAFLASRGATEIPWQQAISTEFDLAISASYGGELHLLQAPTVTIPHGMGYNKYLSNQQSAISNQQSAISNQQSAISNQQSAIRCSGCLPNGCCMRGALSLR
jgi:hypothetical protein